MGVDVISRILPTVKDFKGFWKTHGPFRYALTSKEFPPVLLEPEEWLFSNSIPAIIKALMKWDQQSMAIVPAPFNVRSTAVLKPENLIPWKIKNFPQEWDKSVCSAFTPTGYLTETVALASESPELESVEAAFFECLANDLDSIGYVFLRPESLVTDDDTASLDTYIQEWMDDEA